MHVRKTWIFSLLVCAYLGLVATPAKSEEPPIEAVNLFKEAGQVQNAGDFQLAAELWDGFLAKYEKTELGDKAKHYGGVCHMKTMKYQRAAELFSQVVAAHIDDAAFPLIEDALFNLGICEYSLATQNGQDANARYTAADGQLAKYIAKFPQGKYVDNAWFYRGEALYLAGKTAESIVPYKTIVDSFPKSTRRPNAIYALGVSYQETKKFAEATALFDQFLKEFADHALAGDVRMSRAENWLQEGLAAEASGGDGKPSFAKAEEAFKAAAGTASFDRADRALFQQAAAAARQGKFGEAAVIYASIPAKFPASTYLADAKASAGRTYYQAKQDADSEKWLKESLQGNDKNFAESSHWLCRVYIRTKRADAAYDLAKSSLEKVKDGPFLPFLKMDLADAAYDSAAHKTESGALYVAIVDAFPDHNLAPQALYNAAYFVSEQSKHDETIQLADRFLKAFPKDEFISDVRYLSAEAKLKKGDHAAAIAEYDLLLKSASGHKDQSLWQVRHTLAKVLSKDWAGVVATGGPSIGKLATPELNAELGLYVGTAQFQLNQITEAKATLESVMKLASTWPQLDEVLLLLARCEDKSGRTAEAIQFASKVVTDYPNSAKLDEVAFRLGEFYTRTKKYDEAIREYDTVLKRKGDSLFGPFASVGAAWASLDSGKFEDAANRFTKVLEAYASHSVAKESLLGRGQARRQLNQFEPAIADFQLFIKNGANPADTATATYEVGLCQMGLKQYPEAVKTFDALLVSQPNWERADQVYYQLGWSAKYQQKPVEAVSYFEKLVKSYASSPFFAEAQFHLGEEAYRRGTYAEAITYYTVAKEKSTDAVLKENSAYKIGWSEFQQKKYDAAQKAFEAGLTEFPNGSLKASNLFMLAESFFEQKKFAEALAKYKEAIPAQAGVASVSDDTRIVARLHAAQCANRQKDFKSALEFAQSVTKEFPGKDGEGDAWLEVGEAQFGLVALELAKEAYETAAAKGAPKVAARARCMVGEIYFSDKKFDEAQKQFRRVILGYDDKAEQSVKVWQAYAAFEAARCSHVQIKDATGEARTKLIADAKANYQIIVDKFPNDRLAPEAKKQLEQLNAAK